VEIAFENLFFKHAKTDYPSKYGFHRHIHNLYEILYFKTGKASFSIANKKYLLEKGDLIIIPPALFHYVTAQEKHIYERYVLFFSNKNIPKPLLDECFKKFRIVNIAQRKELTEIFDRFDVHCSLFNNEKLELAIYAGLTELLLHISCVETDTIREELSSNEYVQKAIEFIDNNFCNIHNVDSVLQVVGLSYGYFTHIFKGALKIAPMKYVRAKKMLYAQSLIKQGEKPTNICFNCGFEEYMSFYRAFKKFFGYPPSSCSS